MGTMGSKPTSELCECGHGWEQHRHYLDDYWACDVCGCDDFRERHDPRYDPDDIADQGYSDEGFPYSGLGKVKR